MTPVVLALAGSPAGSMIVKVTVTTALALLCAWLARNSRAAVRHAVLAGALVSEASWTGDELDALKAEIDRVRKERKKQS